MEEQVEEEIVDAEEPTELMDSRPCRWPFDS
jgi:hypothetical protein